MHTKITTKRCNSILCQRFRPNGRKNFRLMLCDSRVRRESDGIAMWHWWRTYMPTSVRMGCERWGASTRSRTSSAEFDEWQGSSRAHEHFTTFWLDGQAQPTTATSTLRWKRNAAAPFSTRARLKTATAIALGSFMARRERSR